MNSEEVIGSGADVIRQEAAVLEELAATLDDTFAMVASEIDCCTGKVAFVGMGKPGRVNGKVAATFCSLGIPSFVMHPGEAMHGDLGVLQKNDLVIVVSFSGESDEVTTILPLIKRYAYKLIAVTGNPDSTLARHADVTMVFPKFKEADGLGLAPTASTTAWLALADALAVAVSHSRGFTRDDFGAFHPAGALGKKLLFSVDRLMATGEANAVVKPEVAVTDAIVEMAKKGLGMTCVVDNKGVLLGVITDGDLRRLLLNHVNVYDYRVAQAMTSSPITVPAGTMAIDALRLMRERNVSCLPVIAEDGLLAGTILLQAIIDAGIVPE
ncbi:MAG: KpsF/GutQ family sugar-phosphate isomerase [Atopobiaceae bacterium]|nr:KpsF/GutQ family sugar-phosphate isomerase [Atopobiaceae bacterium]